VKRASPAARNGVKRGSPAEAPHRRSRTVVGLPRLQAHHLAHRTLAGTAALLQEQDLHPGQLKDMVSSPAGTTIAGLRQLERAGLRSALLEAVLAAAVELRRA